MVTNCTRSRIQKRYLHVRDNRGLIKATLKAAHSNKIRHAFREYNHFGIYKTREELIKRQICNQGEPKPLDIQWIIEDSGNTLQERADRHAARVAFRPTK